MFSFTNFMTTGAVGLALFGSTALAAPADAWKNLDMSNAATIQRRQGTAKNGWCTGHITQWQMHDDDNGTEGVYEVDLILYDANGMFISGFNRGKADGSPGKLTLTATPSPLVMKFTGLDDDPIKMSYDGESWNCPGDNCKMGKYDSGKREGDFGFTCKNLPEA